MVQVRRVRRLLRPTGAAADAAAAAAAVARALHAIEPRGLEGGVMRELVQHQVGTDALPDVQV